MLWESRSAAQSAAPPAAVWALVLDRRWSRWNDHVEWAWFEGPPQAGTILTVKPRRFRQTALLVEDAVAERRLVFGTAFGPVAWIRFTLEVEPAGTGSGIAATVAAGGLLGGLVRRFAAEGIARDAPAMVERLAALAAEPA